MEGETMNELLNNVEGWHDSRGTFGNDRGKAQMVKLMEEMGELARAIIKGQDVKDAIGDCLVVMVGIAGCNNTNLQSCLEVAWNEIKDRTGKLEGGVFIKDTA
jgi:NTP pyrophosphatase (non-canonical NTP hydrolase)